MINVNLLLINFRNFIATNWSFIIALDAEDESEALLIDWLQVNWEMLVERQLPNLKIRLEVYGEGADNGKSSRVCFVDASPTHRILCVPKIGSIVFDVLNKMEIDAISNTLVFDRFVNMRRDGWYYEEPPFKNVLCYVDNVEVILSVDDLIFSIDGYEDGITLEKR